MERSGKAEGRNPVMHGDGKSDRVIVPRKRPNKARGSRGAAEVVEERTLAKGNSIQQNTPRTQRRTLCVPNALERVRQAAQRDRQARFTALMHHVDLSRLKTAYYRLKPKAAPGVDGVTWEEYGRNLEDNLEDLHARLHRGGYRPKPTRRTYIPKADGRQRPLGIAAVEDKVVQAAVVEVMNAIYETDFVGFSYGFRPGRSQHDALDALAVGIYRRRVNWVLDADIRGFFDVIDHHWMMRFLEHRIADKRLLRLLRKWLAAGVLEDGKWTKGEVGTPQGATISPLLANIYLHYAYDLWAHAWRKRCAQGDVILVRYADDTIAGFQHQPEAERFLAELRTRLGRFGLELHAEKTRLIAFGRFAAQRRARTGHSRPECFPFLGFTHICDRTRSGRFLIARHTIAKRLRMRLRAIRDTLRRRMHDPVPAQGAWLRAVVQGYFNYHAVPTNIRAMDRFRTEVARLWYRTLRRRSQRSRITWERMSPLVNRWLPRARILHPWPDDRFNAKTRGRSPVR